MNIMASYIQGYDEERFVTTLNRNFICLICFNVLKDPVLCPRNQHCFCRGCITKHLEHAKRCPTCADELTVETLIEVPRMIKDILNELNIRCVYSKRRCQEILQLQHLERHEATCGFNPAVCTNQDCSVTVNKRDLIHHESEVCQSRKLKCHSCGEITKTLADVEKRIANMETNMETNMATNMETRVTMETQMKHIQTSMATNVANIETRMANVERNMADMKTDIERKLDKVNNEVMGLKAALIEGFDQMKDVLAEMKEENAGKVRNTPSGDRENIIVAGGVRTDSVEMFNWRQRTWSPLQSMPEKRSGATSFVYNNHMTIAGGWSSPVVVDNMIRMNIDPNPDLSTHWNDCPIKLSAKLQYHSSVLCNDQLIVTGGYDGYLGAASDCIHEVQLVPPYNVKTLSRMPEPRQSHNSEIFDDSLLIAGGRRTGDRKDNLNSVVLYDIRKNECKQLAPLPYEVSKMATVIWGDNIVVIGGIDKRGKALNTVIIYNVKTEQSHMLQSMKCKRFGCTAVVVGNNIVVLGGCAEGRALKSVEAFNFESNTWQELPEMSQARHYHTAVVV